ncbi:MAG: replication restart helicase PriA [Anaerolineae bacterium]
MTFVQIAVNVPGVTGVFDYALPAEWTGQIGLGHLVMVPFGKQTVQGVILRLVEKPVTDQVKTILEPLDPQPVLTPAQITLAERMAETTLASLAEIIALMLPPGLAQQSDTLYALRQPLNPTGLPDTPLAARLLKLLSERGPLRGRQIDRHFARVDWRKTAQSLARRGLLSTRSVLPPPRVSAKFVRTAQLAVSPAEAEAALPTLGRTPATLQRRQAALRFLIRTQDAVNVAWVYAESGCTLADLQELAERDLIILRQTEIWRDPLTDLAPIEALATESGFELTSQQAQAWQTIAATFQQATLGQPTRPILLHGVTGSGKTELYLRATEEALRRGRQAIILIPEIALTPQTVRRFLARFPGQVGIWHSRLSEGERYDTWRRARAGLIKVLIGARSAIFAPLPNPGLIVADECHDPSYYQSDPPFYHAVTVAEEYARLTGSVCLFGSATPSLIQRYAAETGQYAYLELSQRVTPDLEGSAAPGAGLPPVRIVDMRAELQSGNRSIFSRQLLEALGETLERGEQAILFLNRRGTATYVFCRACGYALKCPHCDTPLTLHVRAAAVAQSEDTLLPSWKPNQLLCHTCGYSRQKPERCPQCGSNQIREYGLGSEKVEAEVQALFPQARTLRWDWETTRQKDAHEMILSHFAAHRADVLVGTQMLAKGLDLPLVTLVGIVLADVGLNLPDPFAAERLFQVLTQVAGRAGRSSRGGRVLLQTFVPEHPIIQAAAQHDYATFYARELSQRRALGYPPFGRLIRLEKRDQDAVRAEAEGRRMAEKIRGWIAAEGRRATTLVGPVPCFFARQAGWYRWQIILRGPQPETLLRGRDLSGWRVEVDPISLL